MRYVEKHFRAGQTTEDNTAHAHCMLDTYGYKHTLRLFNPLTPELNPSAQRCLPRVFTWDFNF
jgi:hypothetical protein